MIVIDMDMPKSCTECPIGCIKFYPNDDKSCCPIKCDIEDIKSEMDDALKACVSIEDNTEKGIYPRIYSKDEMDGRKITYEHCLKIIDKHIGVEMESEK